MEQEKKLLTHYKIGVAVCAAEYSFDTLFTYVAEQSILPGCRVVVPFGRGNTRRVGIVLSCEAVKGMEEQWKPVLSLVDEMPILSEEMVELVFWLKDMTFCTYFDAVRTILPSGLQVQLVEQYLPVKDADTEQLSDGEKRFLQMYTLAKTGKERQRILEDSGSKGKKLLRSLTEKGCLTCVESVKEKTHGSFGIKMLRLIPNVEKPFTKTQQKLLDLLQREGTLSEKEACYLSGVSSAVAKKLVENGLIEAYTVKPHDSLYKGAYCTASVKDIKLSAEQQSVYDRLAQSLTEGMHIFLLHGVTGSGKTSVFLKLIDTVIQQDKQVILLVPEIALTPQIVEQFYRLFGKIVAVVHSELSLGQRSETWRKIADGTVKIIIGTRSAVFAPCKNLGLIVADEEGERTYKSDQSPRYHAISVAKKRCVTHQCPLLLASATPSVESYYYAQKGIYELLELKHRYNQSALPQVEIVDMMNEPREGEGIFSTKLVEALRENFNQKNQSLLLLNRRGYHTIFSCASCNKPIYCPNCSVPMTYHKVNNSLMCHYCGHTQEPVRVCPSCGSEHVRMTGFGTQRVEEELERLVPSARILRMDADTTMSRTAYVEQFEKFRAGEYDIMLGTQMIGKGLDFPKVTLVGVVSVDKSLYAGDFRSYERTFSLVTQVVGRSGRGALSGKAMLQSSMVDHYVLQLAARQDYIGFYEQEIALRRQLIFPPICDICVFGFTGVEENLVRQAAETTVNVLKKQIQEKQFQMPLWLLHPVPCSYGKINGKYRWQLIMKCKNTQVYRNLIRDVLLEVGADRSLSKVHIFADMNGDIGV